MKISILTTSSIYFPLTFAGWGGCSNYLKSKSMVLDSRSWQKSLMVAYIHSKSGSWRSPPVFALVPELWLRSHKLPHSFPSLGGVAREFPPGLLFLTPASLHFTAQPHGNLSCPSPHLYSRGTSSSSLAASPSDYNFLTAVSSLSSQHLDPGRGLIVADHLCHYKRGPYLRK